MRRREFIRGLGSAALWQMPARAQPAGRPVVALVNGGAAGVFADYVTAFRNGLGEIGYFETQNVTIEYHWLEGHYERLPALMAELTRRRVAVIATPASNAAALAAKAATDTIPIVFGVNNDPVKLHLVASLSKPGGNATGINFLTGEVVTKRAEFFRLLLPNAVNVALLLNPANPSTADETLLKIQEASGPLGFRISVLHASTIDEIDAAFTSFKGDRPDALFVAADTFFGNRRTQLSTLAAGSGIPASYANRIFIAAGGLMSYGTDVAKSFHQVGVYVGQILNGTKPADLPVVQPTRFELVINLQTAKQLGIKVPPELLAVADELIE
jgi:putative tryptophan/tyrosine transport system substrate-binding protein